MIADTLCDTWAEIERRREKFPETYDYIKYELAIMLRVMDVMREYMDCQPPFCPQIMTPELLRWCAVQLEYYLKYDEKWINRVKQLPEQLKDSANISDVVSDALNQMQDYRRCMPDTYDWLAPELDSVEEVMKAGQKDLEFAHKSRFVTPTFLRQLADRLESLKRDTKQLAELEK